MIRVRLRGKVVGLAIMATALAFGFSAHCSAQSQNDRTLALPKDVVYLRDIDPTIIQDIRYAGTNNFSGRRLGGYDKSPVPFAEFRWARYFRENIKTYPTRADFDTAVAEALKIAHDPAAKDLPGYKPR